MKKQVKEEIKIETPSYTALSVQRKESLWQVVEYIIQNSVVIKVIPIKEPTFKADALNTFRVESAKRFMGDS